MIDRVGTSGTTVAGATKALTEATVRALATAPADDGSSEDGVVVSLSPEARAAASAAGNGPLDPRAALAPAALAQAVAGTAQAMSSGPAARYRANSVPTVHPNASAGDHHRRDGSVSGPVIRWLALLTLGGVVLWLMLGRGA